MAEIPHVDKFIAHYKDEPIAVFFEDEAYTKGLSRRVEAPVPGFIPGVLQSPDMVYEQFKGRLPRDIFKEGALWPDDPSKYTRLPEERRNSLLERGVSLEAIVSVSALEAASHIQIRLLQWARQFGNTTLRVVASDVPYSQDGFTLLYDHHNVPVVGYQELSLGTQTGQKFPYGGQGEVTSREKKMGAMNEYFHHLRTVSLSQDKVEELLNH